MEFAIERSDDPAVDYPDERWAALGQAIRRQLRLYTWNQTDLIRESGVSNMTIRPVMAGEPGNRQEKTLAKISRALGWGGEGIVRILEGADPEQYIQDQRDEEAVIDLNSEVAHLPLEVQRQILDTVREEVRKQQS